MPCFTPRNNPSVVGTTRNTRRLHREVRTPVLLSAYTRLVFKTSCVDFGINRCAINCLTLVNGALVFWMLRFADKCDCVRGAIWAGQRPFVILFSRITSSYAQIYMNNEYYAYFGTPTCRQTTSLLSPVSRIASMLRRSGIKTANSIQIVACLQVGVPKWA